MENAYASREILWNVNSPAEVTLMYMLFALSLLVAGSGVARRCELWLGGQPDSEHTAELDLRTHDLLRWGLFQRGVVRDRSAMVFHTLIYLGFLSLLFATTMVFLDHDLGLKIYRGEFYLGVTILSDVLGFGLLIGCMLAYHRRSLARLDRLHRGWSENAVLALLALLVAQGFLLEGLRIHATRDPWAAYSPIGNGVAHLFWFLSVDAARVLHYGTWWFHTVTVFVVFAIVPYTKFFHIIASSANLFFRKRRRPAGALRSPGDLEQLIESGEEFSIGLGTIKDYTWKQRLDLDACTSCGRCQAECPAYLSGTVLSPKWLVLDTRNHMLALHGQGALESGPSRVPAPLRAVDRLLVKDLYLASSGIAPGVAGNGLATLGRERAENPRVQHAVRSLGVSAESLVAGEVLDPGVFWSCTTCMACVEACPVGIDHVDQIVGNRRHMALMRGEIPSEAQATLRSLEARGNPYGDPADRSKWLEDLGVPVLSPGDSVEYLYWVGCVSAYDPRKQKIARSLVALLKRAGVSFGVLGNAEACTGDPARRLGEENLFQMLAKRNIATLRTVKFRTLVANCPHCFNTIGNEYPQFGQIAGDGEPPRVIHHSVLLRELVEAGKLEFSDGPASEFTFHDPCYLGRYNREFDAPRDALTSVPGATITEMARSRERGMCCGAGGGHFWMDLKAGDRRVNAIRTDQAAETKAPCVATACPFCMQMMEDGVKITNREGALEVRDIAEVMAERLR